MNDSESHPPVRSLPIAAIGLTGRIGKGMVVMVLLATIGCPGVAPPPVDNNGDFTDGNRDPSLTSPIGKTIGEPNDDFDIPVVAVFDRNGLAELKGTVATQDDLDVFLLGSFERGDRIVIDAFAAGAMSLDVSIALFDDQRRLVSENDDRADTNLDSRIDFTVRHDGDPYYLVVTRSAFASSRRKTGAYVVDVQVSKGHPVPPPVGQALLLDFDGGAVNSAVLGSMTLPPFDAGDISPVYAGRTDVMKREIRDVIRQNYERFDVTVFTTDDPPPAADTVFSTIFFGGFDQTAFGIAENVDLYNADRCDDAIIFTQSFTPSLFSRVPTAVEMGYAIGNVASHEAGHLLGLNHVDDDLDIMDDRSPADSFLLDQEFKVSKLSGDIMPIGTQDGPILLFESIGPRGPVPTSHVARRAPAIWADPYSPGGEMIVRRLSPKPGSR